MFARNLIEPRAGSETASQNARCDIVLLCFEWRIWLCLLWLSHEPKHSYIVSVFLFARRTHRWQPSFAAFWSFLDLRSSGFTPISWPSACQDSNWRIGRRHA